MIKRTLEISSEPTHLSVRDGQLLIIRKDLKDPSTAQEVRVKSIAGTVPLEDIGLVMVDQRDTTFSHSALSGLAENGAAVCVCGPNHLPAGLLLPFADRHETVWRIKDQIAISRPTKKRLWRQIVRAKILGQSKNLPENSAAAIKLMALRDSVRSGDPSNVEAQAAKLYWGQWLGVGNTFRRFANPERMGQSPNNLLDYGYAVMRAAVARAIVSAGLLPAIGIHHDSRSNSFCLADDLVEPLRPIVDHRVRDLFQSGVTTLSREAKQSLLSLLHVEVGVTQLGEPRQSHCGPLLVVLHRYLASFVECIPSIREGQKLAIPTIKKF